MNVRCKYDELVDLTALKPHPQNRNKHPKEQVQRLAKILDYQGWRYPVKVSLASGCVTSGHGRIEAAKANGWQQAPVNYQEYDSAEQEYADVQADNAIASWAEMDLSGINADIGQLGPDFDIDLLGIEGFEIEVADKGGEDDVPSVPATAFCRTGDLFTLGSHRLLCGDSTDSAQVLRLMNGEKADMVFTDPPYGIGLDYATHDDSEALWFALIDKLMPIAKAAAQFVMMPCCRIKALPWWYRNHTPDWIMCWYKGSPGHRSHVGFNDWEPHLVWGKPKNQMHDYWQTACGFEVDGHPCPKPVAYAQWVLERAVDKGDLVLDFFTGSGTTLIACEKTNRKCYGMEIDPLYCDVILDRWAKFTGQEPKHEDGTPWSYIKDGGD